MDVNALTRQKHDLYRSFDKKEITQEIFDKKIIILDKKIDEETRKIINEKSKQFGVKSMDEDNTQIEASEEPKTKPYVGDDILVLLKILEDNLMIRIKELLKNKREPSVTLIGHPAVDTKDLVKEVHEKTINRHQAIIQSLMNSDLNTKELVINNVMKQRPQDTRKQVSDQLSGVISYVKAKNPKFKQYSWDEEKYLLREK